LSISTSEVTQRSTSNDSFAYTGDVNVNRAYAVTGFNQHTSAAILSYDLNGNLAGVGANAYACCIGNHLVNAGGFSLPPFFACKSCGPSLKKSKSPRISRESSCQPHGRAIAKSLGGIGMRFLLRSLLSIVTFCVAFLHTSAFAQELSTDPQGSGVIVNAMRWMQGTLLGTVATVVAVIAIASVGLLMLTGRINWRHGGVVILGCFILFGAASIVAGIQSAATLSGGG
jgi:type IV secretion system protein VirB2